MLKNPLLAVLLLHLEWLHLLQIRNLQFLTRSTRFRCDASLCVKSSPTRFNYQQVTLFRHTKNAFSNLTVKEFGTSENASLPSDRLALPLVDFKQRRDGREGRRKRWEKLRNTRVEFLHPDARLDAEGKEWMLLTKKRSRLTFSDRKTWKDESRKNYQRNFPSHLVIEKF